MPQSVSGGSAEIEKDKRRGRKRLASLIIIEISQVEESSETSRFPTNQQIRGFVLELSVRQAVSDMSCGSIT
jgi:hypothetical protein